MERCQVQRHQERQHLERASDGPHVPGSSLTTLSYNVYGPATVRPLQLYLTTCMDQPWFVPYNPILQLVWPSHGSPLTTLSYIFYGPATVRPLQPYRTTCMAQRSVRALERYGHHAESVMVGTKLTDAILAFNGCAGNGSECRFTLEIDPFTSKPMWAPWSPPDGYVPLRCRALSYRAFYVLADVGAVAFAHWTRALSYHALGVQIRCASRGLRPMIIRHDFSAFCVHFSALFKKRGADFLFIFLNPLDMVPLQEA